MRLRLVPLLVLSACSATSPDTNGTKSDAQSNAQIAALESRVRELEAGQRAKAEQENAAKIKAEKNAAAQDRLDWIAGRWSSLADGSGCDLVPVYYADGTWEL